MTDLLQRLRAFPTDAGTDVHATFDLIEAAADEIERLRAALEQIRDYHVIQGMSPSLFAEKVLRPTPSIAEQHNGD